MQRRRIAFEPAYVLHARPYSDTSLLLDVFTVHHGRVGLIARGARAPKSRQRALLQVLQPLLLSWNESGELGTLTAVEAASSAIVLTGEPLFCAWYANELLMRLSQRGDPHPLLFAAYSDLLPKLACDAEAALREFEQTLLAESGYGLLLPDELSPTSHYRYDWQSGPLPAAAGEPGSLSGASLIALRDGVFNTPQARREARWLMRAALQRQLGGKPLQTAQLLQQLRLLDAAAPET